MYKYYILIITFLLSCNKRNSLNKTVNSGDNEPICLQYKDIYMLDYNKNSSPIVVCLREELARHVADNQLHLKNIDAREYLYHMRDNYSRQEVMNFSDSEVIQRTKIQVISGFDDKEKALQDTLCTTIKIKHKDTALEIYMNKNKAYKLKKGRKGKWKIIEVVAVSISVSDSGEIKYNWNWKQDVPSQE